jgi:diphosphomevalonate decarboxylase
MHAVMLTSVPSLLYWEPSTVTIMQAVHSWRKAGLPVCYTIDAGPNVHVICTKESSPEIAAKLERLPDVRKVMISHPGGSTRLENNLSTI